MISPNSESFSHSQHGMLKLLSIYSPVLSSELHLLARYLKWGLGCPTGLQTFCLLNE